ncbi:YcxB family protein [Hymenobacter sp. B81]|uniref:YcxB family protein n=1 Tax=Hymenobacter sp. B81 TaxID=3344878 RepID=UPI0037DCACD5
MQPIVISEVTVTFEEFAHIHRQLSGRRRLLILLMAPLVFGYFFWADSGTERGGSLNPTSIGFYALITVAFTVMQLFIFKRAVRRVYANGKSFLAPTTYILSDEGVSMFSSEVQAELQWSAIQRATELPGWWYLQASGAGFLLDAARIQPPATAAEVTQLLRGRNLLK